MAKRNKRFQSPDELLREIVQSDFDLAKFDQIDESDFPKAKNFVDWTLGRDFCNATLLPWQVEAGMHLFSDYCPECSNPEYLYELFDEPIEEIRDNVSFLEHGLCPKCNKNRLELFAIGEFEKRPSLKNEFIGNLGQRSGKCLGASTEILTPKGPIKIQDIQVGDIVYGWNKDGSVSETKVINKFNQGIKKVRDLTTRGRLLASCTDEHRWLTVRCNIYQRGNVPEPRELQLKEFINKKDIAIHRKFIKIPCGDIFEPHAYALGAFLGNGCCLEKIPKIKKQYKFHISTPYGEIPEKIKQILNASEVQKLHDKNYTWAILKEEIYCNHYLEWCSGRYAHEKICDLNTIKTWNRQSCLEFLAGLVDTDGSVYVDGKGQRLVISFGCQALPVVEAFQHLIYKLFQYKPEINEDKRDKYVNGSVFYCAVASTFHCKRIMDELNPFLVNPDRKWKIEYENLASHNNHPEFVRPKFGEPYDNQTYDIEVDNETNLYLLAHEGLITHNSKMVVTAATYQLHRWLKLPDPLSYFGLPRMEVVLGTFSALSAEQAEENLWMPFRGLYDAAPWFKKYNDFLKAEEKRLSIPLADLKETYIFYPHKRIILSFTGSDDRKKRGRTRFLGAIDEIAFLNSDGQKKKVMDADKNYAALTNSLSTIRQKAVKRMIEKGDFDVPLPIMYNASSPYNVLDKIMRLTKEAPVKNPWAVVVHRASWDANPDYDERSCRNINPNISEMEFQRDFGAIPPFSDSPYISEARVLEKLCEPISPIVDARPEIFTDKMGDNYLFLKAKIIKIDKMTPRLLALDNGFKQNAFGACIFRYDPHAKKPVLEFAANLYPDPETNHNINFLAMFEGFILPIVQGLRIRHVFYDRWQSLDQIQRLRDMKIDAQAHSLSFEKDLLPFKQQLLSGNMILPPSELSVFGAKETSNPLMAIRNKPIATLIWQCLTVREAGKKLLKPLEGDDDLFRAFALGGSRFMKEEIRKEYLTGYNGVKQQLSGVLGSFHSIRGAALGVSSGPTKNIGFAQFKSGSKK